MPPHRPPQGARGAPRRPALSALCRELTWTGFLTLLLIVALCALWNWKKWKKRRTPYRRVEGLPSLNRPRCRQQTKNIYDRLPRRLETPGRTQARSTQLASTESLLSRDSSSPASEHQASQAESVPSAHTSYTRVSVDSGGIYDNTLGPPMCENRAPSALEVSGGAPGKCPSTSSEDSLDYVNVSTAVEVSETGASASSTPESLSVALGAQELALTEEGDQEDIWDCSSVRTPGSKSSDSDADVSSEASNDYVNMEGLDGGAVQGRQPCVAPPRCRDYENIPAAAHHSNQQQQVEEEMTFPRTDPGEGGTDESGSPGQQAAQPGRFLALGDQVTHPPAARSEDSPVEHGEKMSHEDCHDYENVQVVRWRDSVPSPVPS
ncbi:lymphocyte transmembrane adapter 1 [Sorex araneus]|uniref:lymphocyte transmembrane adapter 1 n=1 Tax=Sorex araneus TaxID=42254 RepID=UPI002433BA9A|nr:lymphocyte transmembrane adapter 1 [Sorex araneus]